METLDGQRLATNNAITTPIRHGIYMAFGSDNLPIGMYTRNGVPDLRREARANARSGKLANMIAPPDDPLSISPDKLLGLKLHGPRSPHT